MAAVCRSTADRPVIWQLWVKKKPQHLGPAHREAMASLPTVSERGGFRPQLPCQLQFRGAFGALFYLLNSGQNEAEASGG